MAKRYILILSLALQCLCQSISESASPSSSAISMTNSVSATSTTVASYTQNPYVMANSVSASITPRIIQLQPIPSVFSQITNHEWNYIVLVPGFIVLCIFSAILNQHIRLNKLEKQMKNIKPTSTTNPIRTNPPLLSSTV